MRKTDLADLAKTVEQLREKIHPELNPDFLRAVIEAEGDNQEDNDSARVAIENALQAELRRQGLA